MAAGPPTSPVEVPALVRAFAERIDDVVWANEIGGLTFVAGDRLLTWNPLGSGVDLDDERARLSWARAVGHPVPIVLDLGALGVGDRWADLAIASLSLDGNYGEGWQELFFEAYGVERDEERIRYYRAAWDDGE